MFCIAPLVAGLAVVVDLAFDQLLIRFKTRL
jgi:hypothetical protein